MAFPAGRLSHDQQAARVRDGLRKRGYRADALNDQQVTKVLQHVGDDTDLCISAIALWPRPPWVEQLIGASSHDRALGEMLDPADRATVDEWGPLG